MSYTHCPRCIAFITAEIKNGFTQDFHLTQSGRLLLPVTNTGYEIEQLVVTTCIDCTHSIYRVITCDGHKGMYVDAWDITTI